MRIKQTIIVSVLAVFLCAAAALSQDKRMASQEKASGGTKVTITNNKFEPKTVTIKVGSEVTWENKGGSCFVNAPGWIKSRRR